MKQLSIFDVMPFAAEGRVDSKTCASRKKPDHPLCYDCQYAIRRGGFRLCRLGHRGYRTIGKFFGCEDYDQVCEDSGKDSKKRHRDSKRP